MVNNRYAWESGEPGSVRFRYGPSIISKGVREMTEERIVERTVEREPQTTVIEKRGSGAGVVLGILALAVVVLLAWFLFAQNRNDSARTDAVSGAAQSVEKAADKVGDAADGK